MIAPPAIAVDKRPEALVVYSLRPLTESEKIVANITELHNPTAIIVQAAVVPVLLTDTAISTTAINAQQVKTNAGFTILRI
jgi:hypothetical protein